MKEPQFLNTKIANVTLKIPIHENLATTNKIIAKIEEKIHQIERKSPRVDTQAFALQVAYDFATQLHQANREIETVNKDMLIALDALKSRLQELLSRQAQQD